MGTNAEVIDVIVKSGVVGCLVLLIAAIVKGTFLTRKHHEEVMKIYDERLKEAEERESFWREAWRATDSQLDRSVSIAEKVIKR